MASYFLFLLYTFFYHLFLRSVNILIYFLPFVSPSLFTAPFSPFNCYALYGL